ncbi:pteridine reductase [Saccharobesus litoralis]|uniref:Pteridine reductase n=1 Tax=Saccharobesus litoralis TaxID=2172099 RepID=A0A2S0VSZ8_9ALTE|nr:pteridine reductase [Saccharobesus litoralis]AWB67341.1 pteridine reductase [Saccharobesus litoralis]
MTEKVVLVTGSAKRVGAQIIKTFHQQGFNCLIHCRHSIDEAEVLKQSLNKQRDNSVDVIQADLNQFEDIHQLAEQANQRFGRLDVLVNNASSFYPTPVGDAISPHHWQDLFSSNAQAPLFLSNALAPALKKSQGCIINLTDIHAENPLRHHTIYCMAKAALVMMTKSLAKELAPDIRVNAVSPGAILWPEQTLTQDAKDQVINEIALERMGSPEDIASTIYFLAQQAPYVTGQILAVDGGRSLGRHALA